MDKQGIARIARTVLRAFLELQRGLAADTLTAEQLDAIDSLPSGDADKRSPVDGSVVEIVLMTGRLRISRFPTACCSDTTAVLGIIYTMAGIKPKEIIEVKATPREWNPAFNFHKWLSVEGLAIDITLGQFHPLSEHIGNAVAFTEHPFEPGDVYAIERTRFVPPREIVKFAEHIGFAHIFLPEEESVK